MGVDPGRLWAEGEAAIPGEDGRARDQEVVSQGERAESRDAAADRDSAVDEVYVRMREGLDGIAQGRERISCVESTSGDGATRLLIVRSERSQRSLTIEFDPQEGITVSRDEDETERIDPTREARAMQALEDAIEWLSESDVGSGSQER